MSKSSTTKRGKKVFKNGPNPQNQPCLSPASSSNEQIPTNPDAKLRNEILEIYLGGYIGGQVVPQGGEERIINRPDPNNGVFPFTTPPRANNGQRDMGPHLSPTAQLPTESLNITGESDPNMTSTCRYHGEQTPESLADSSAGVGPSNVSTKAKLKTTKEWLNRNLARTLFPNKEKYPKNESW